MPVSRPPHVVCFAPYTTWSIHSARQVTILQALRLRGATVTYVTCDSVFSDCDVLQPANGAPAAKPANACLICQSSVAARLAAWGMPYRWLGRWLTTADFAAAARWAHGVRPQDMPNARYEDWAIGSWMISSVHTHLRQNTLDLAESRTAGVFASYLYSGLLAALGVSRLLDEERPDFLLLFNGRMGVMRTALEIGKQRGIRLLAEERGLVPGHLALFENTHCLDWRGLVQAWEVWKNVPLSASEIADLGKVLMERRSGRRDSISFIVGKEDGEEARAALKLDPSKPVWALFTSNLDEVAGMDLAPAAFPTHDAWVLASVGFARRRPDIQLVIRVHPNSGSRRSFSSNRQELSFYADLASSLPANVRLVHSDDALNSYSLIALAGVGLTWHSTIGVEMAALGKPVVRAGSPELGSQPGLLQARTPEEYERLLLDLGGGRVPDPLALARDAWRFGYLAFFRDSFPFPLVKQTDWHVGEMNFDGLEALAPGRDAALDRICGHIMTGMPLHADPPLRGDDVAAAEAEAIGRWIAEARAKNARPLGK